MNRNTLAGIAWALAGLIFLGAGCYGFLSGASGWQLLLLFGLIAFGKVGS